jgi:hypothetical protein
MSRTVFHTDQMVRQEQCKDLREVEYYCLAKTVARPPPSRLMNVAAALREAVVGSTCGLPGFRPMEEQARS